MSLQVFLQARLDGSEQFLSLPLLSDTPNAEFAGRCAWLGLVCEIVPRALLRTLGLSHMLLGSSSAKQFLLVLTDESIGAASEFLAEIAGQLRRISQNTLRLEWAHTENLGAWRTVRRRLDDGLAGVSAAPLRATGGDSLQEWFGAFEEDETDSFSEYFIRFAQASNSPAVGWSKQSPGLLVLEGGELQWSLTDSAVSPGDDSSLLRPFLFATTSDGALAGPQDFAQEASGAARCGVIVADVDHFQRRLERAESIEEHIQLSILWKDFFAGELSLLCSLPEFQRRISVAYRGGNDFLLLGSWDALIDAAREMQRVFDKFVTKNTGGWDGTDGKSITMALSISPAPESPLHEVCEQAFTGLESAKVTEPGTFYLFGRPLEWKRVSDAEELKNAAVRLVRDFGVPPSYIGDLAAVYREAYSASASRRTKALPIEKPWRTYMRLSRIVPRQRESNAVRTTLVTHLLGTKTANAKLRPSGRVGLEWARLSNGS